MSLKIIGNPLVSVDDVRTKAWQNGNENITDEEIEQIQRQAHGLILAHVASRYDIEKMTDDIFNDSPAHDFLKSISMELWSSLLTLKYFGVQKLSEDNNAQASYNLQITLLTDIRDWQLRLLDNTYQEFYQLPLKATRTVPNEIVSSFNDTTIIPAVKVFKVDKIW